MVSRFGRAVRKVFRRGVPAPKPSPQSRPGGRSDPVIKPAPISRVPPAPISRVPSIRSGGGGGAPSRAPAPKPIPLAVPGRPAPKPIAPQKKPTVSRKAPTPSIRRKLEARARRTPQVARKPTTRIPTTKKTFPISTPRGKRLVDSSGKVVGKVPPLKPKAKLKILPRRDKEVGRERREKVKKLFTKKELGKQIGFNTFEKEANKQGDKIFKEVSDFANKRQSFYQSRVSAGLISVGEADKKIREDVNKKQNELVNKNEFFREKNPRRPTTNSAAFGYETDRLKALKEGDQKTADVSAFLRIVAETPSSLVKLGSNAKKGIDKLVKDPKAREQAIQNIKSTFSIEKTKKLPEKIGIKATELTKFALTSPTTALAIVGGTLVSFALLGGAISKVGKPVLQLTGVVSKDASKRIIRNLKFEPFTKKGLSNIGNITIQVSPRILKEVGKITGTAKPLAVSAKATNKIIQSINKSIKESKIGTRATKISKGAARVRRELSTERLRTRKRRLAKRIKNLESVKKVRLKAKKITVAKERVLLKKRVKKKRKEKVKRRKVLLAQEKFEKSEVGKLSKEIKVAKERAKRKLIKGKVTIKVKEKSIAGKVLTALEKRKLKTQQAKLRKQTFKRRKQKIKRRAALLRQEKFRRSRVGKIKVIVSKRIKRLDKIIKKFETPSAELVFPRAKTPLKKTFPREIKLQINDAAVKKFVKKQVKLRGFDFDKLSGIEKNFLLGQVKSRIRSQPSKFIPKERQLALQRIKEKKPKKVPREQIKLKIQKGGEITITKVPPTAPTRRTPLSKTFPREARQVLLQKQKQKKPTRIITETTIVPTTLNRTQTLALRRLRNVQNKQTKVQREISKLKQRQQSKQITQKQKLRNKKQIKSKSRQLGRLGVISLQLFGKISKQKITPKLAQPLLTGQLQPSVLAQPQAQAQKAGQPSVRPPAVPKPVATTKPIVPLRIRRKKVRPTKKKPIKKKAYSTFARPLKRKGQKKRSKLVKISKVPLDKIRAKDLRNFITDQSLSRTGRIKRTKGEPQKPKLKVPKGYAKRTSKKFRRFRKVKGKRKLLPKGKVIERKGRLLDTKSERQGINLRKRLKQLERKSGFKKSKRKSKSKSRRKTRRK
jgi:hypothetical protein